jgi:acyl carrier protein
MEINEFIKMFSLQFDETDESEIKAETEFRQLDEWSSLIGLAVMTSIRKKCGVELDINDFKSVSTVSELFELVNSKQKS